MGSLDGRESVLCVPADVIDRIGRWEGFRPLGDDFDAVLAEVMRGAMFRPRTVGLEHGQKGLEFRQLIPYVVLRERGDERVFVYRRPAEGGDSRLRRKLSMGLGGHPNPVDADATGRDAVRDLTEDVLVACALRELREEVAFGDGDGEVVTSRIVGLINDEGDDVGRRHLGVVFLLTTGAEPRPVRFEVEAGGWFTPAGLRSYPVDAWEGWSRILVPHVESILADPSRRVTRPATATPGAAGR